MDIEDVQLLHHMIFYFWSLKPHIGHLTLETLIILRKLYNLMGILYEFYGWINKIRFWWKNSFPKIKLFSSFGTCVCPKDSLNVHSNVKHWHHVQIEVHQWKLPNNYKVSATHWMEAFYKIRFWKEKVKRIFIIHKTFQ